MIARLVHLPQWATLSRVRFECETEERRRPEDPERDDGVWWITETHGYTLEDAKATCLACRRQRQRERLQKMH